MLNNITECGKVGTEFGQQIKLIACEAFASQFKEQLMKYLKGQFYRYSSTKVLLMCSNAYCYIILPFLMLNNITE